MSENIFIRDIKGIDVKESSCILCKICQNNCPVSAITVKSDERTWSIDRDICILCEACTKICPKDALSVKDPCRGTDEKRLYDSFNIKEVKSIRQIHKEAMKNRSR